MTKNQKKKNKLSFFTQLLRVLILILVFTLILISSYLLYTNFWLRFKDARAINHNIKLHNQMERKTSEVLDRINRKIAFNKYSSQEIQVSLETARQENAKLTEIIAEYQSKSKELKPSNNLAGQNLKQGIIDSFEVRSQVLLNFQEVNNYLICLGQNTLKLTKLQEQTKFYTDNPEKINTDGSLARFNRQLAELSETANQDMAKIPSCFTEKLKPYKDPDLKNLIQESQEILLENIQINTEKQSKLNQNLELPLFLDENRQMLEAPLELLTESESKLAEIDAKLQILVDKI